MGIADSQSTVSGESATGMTACDTNRHHYLAGPDAPFGK